MGPGHKLNTCLRVLTSKSAERAPILDGTISYTTRRSSAPLHDHHKRLPIFTYPMTCDLCT